MARTGRARHADAAKVEVVAKPVLAALTNELVDKGIPHHVVVDEIEVVLEHANRGFGAEDD
ncbi:MAG: hypothetical protein OXH15_04930 [Gammaproteobacteria bacterium]|nr:hypothetical protein [Gammaproteobacteria bacterium]